MTDTTAFDTSNKSTTTNAFEALVGDGKKFKDNEALAKGKIEADAYIEQLQREARELRDELKKRPTDEDVAKRVKETLQSVTKQTTDAVNQPVFKEEDLAKMIDTTIEARSARQTAEGNIMAVTKRLDDLYGDRQKAQTALLDKAKELGVSVKDLEATAAKSPKAFFNLVGIPDTPVANASNGVKTKGSVNTDALNMKTPSEDTWEYYQHLRKTDKRKYFSPSVQNEIHRKVQEGKIVLPK